MKRKLAVAACVVAGCIATSGTVHASTQSYTCTYKVKMRYTIFVTMYGYDNTSAFCRTASKGWGIRWYGLTSGRIRCTFQGTEGDINMVVRSRQAWIGRKACNLFESEASDWIRTG